MVSRMGEGRRRKQGFPGTHTGIASWLLAATWLGAAGVRAQSNPGASGGSGGFGGGAASGSTRTDAGVDAGGARSDGGLAADADAARSELEAGLANGEAFSRSSVREEIVGFDAALQTLVYVERMPSGLAGFSHATLVSVSERNERSRVPLTTATDVERLRITRDPALFREIDGRIARAVDEARARLGAGAVLPAVETDARVAAGRCASPPLSARTFAVGDVGVVRVTPSADERSSRLQFLRGSLGSNVVDVPSVSLVEPATGRAILAPYDRVADARELPGTDRIALLLRSDRCAPEGAHPVVTAALLEPPPDAPLPPLEHAEWTDSQALRLLAPRARRRTVDEVDGWFERNGTRVVYDNAWRVPNEPDLLLVQFSRHDRSLSPTVAMSGHAPSHFALARSRRGRWEMIFQFAPSVRGAYEGASQEATTADLDGDGRPEVFVRARAQDGSEYLTLLRVSPVDLQYVWSTEVAIDGRRGGASACCANNVTRRCRIGLDGRSLVLRCRHDTWSGTGPDARVVSSRVRIERVRYNGGTASIETSER
jgi:hypothetical protein